ncbi:MAG: hypothetical protein CUN56_01185 [Phototrophicales bacterium]|nr:MAG: hypothetical protein CUN56_01185 [Phototrophicales bacterium]RMG75943.1 MAG: sulfite exporter TauE/SafE family protein [Chloroflexota bacterium]
MKEFVIFTLIGFIAQLVNGSLGMAYGMISMSFLLTFGIPPLMANATVQVTKLFSAAVSTVSHWKFGNVDYQTFIRLAAAGVAGSLGGSLLAVSLPNTILTPLIAVYLFFMGLRILHQCLKHTPPHTHIMPKVMPLGALGGFLNALGGAGWGPVTTSTLLANASNPRLTIGTVSAAELFVSIAAAIVLISHIQFANLQMEIVLGLIVGGMCAAPLAAYLTGHLPTRTLTGAISLLIMFLSVSMVMSVLA